jgi:hypothetical protein
LALTVNAEYLTVNIADYNTQQPVDSVNVSVFNGSIYITSELTDSYGIVIFELPNASYNIISSKLNYDVDNSYVVVSGNTTENILLMPESPEGILRFRVSDLTLNDHTICFFFKENNRLDDCFQINETIQINQNTEYIVYFIPEFKDILFTENAESLMGDYTILLKTFFILILIIGVMSYVVFKK